MAVEPGLLLSSFLHAGPSPPCKVSHQILTAWTVELTLSSPVLKISAVCKVFSGSLPTNLIRERHTQGRDKKQSDQAMWYRWQREQTPRSSDSLSPPCPSYWENSQYPLYPNSFQILTATFQRFGGLYLFWVLGYFKVAGIMISWSLFSCFIIVILGKRK